MVDSKLLELIKKLNEYKKQKEYGIHWKERDIGKRLYYKQRKLIKEYIDNITKEMFDDITNE